MTGTSEPEATALRNAHIKLHRANQCWQASPQRRELHELILHQPSVVKTIQRVVVIGLGSVSGPVCDCPSCEGSTTERTLTQTATLIDLTNLIDGYAGRPRRSDGKVIPLEVVAIDPVFTDVDRQLLNMCNVRVSRRNYLEWVHEATLVVDVTCIRQVGTSVWAKAQGEGKKGPAMMVTLKLTAKALDPLSEEETKLIENVKAQYLVHKFPCRAGPNSTSEVQWEWSKMSKEERILQQDLLDATCPFDVLFRRDLTKGDDH